ncbi:MAG: DUF5694 domain-containing protein [Bacteroidales bacterium]|nr:DUF5694 domain-containing protein [Bacteroidales bacterium]
MKKLIVNIKLSLIVLILVGLNCGAESIAATNKILSTDTTKVLVVGTIHGNHEANKFYSYQDVVNILATYKPDAICVEIPQSYFRSRSYLKEMVLATIYGTEKSIPVYPIDWWSPGNDRAINREYVKTAEYKEKEKQYYALEKTDSIMQRFYAKYESLEKVWNSNQKGSDFFNGEEYNSYIREMYSINMKVFGDGPMNLHYLTRNNHMLSLIDSVITKNRGKRVIVLTGAEHKHFFDDALSARIDLKVVNFQDILPLKHDPADKTITDYIERDMARNYYEAGSSDGVDLMYQGVLISLTHGLGMDDDPSIIPSENITKAEEIVKEWKAEKPKSAYLIFEIGWINFLKGDYKNAIKVLKVISNRLNEIPESKQWFVKPYYFRNLAFCYDMIGKHDEAVKNYNSGIEACKDLKMSDSYIKSTFKNYIEDPYNGQKRK